MFFSFSDTGGSERKSTVDYSSDFVTNGCGESWDSSLWKIMSPEVENASAFM